ncbi:hydrophobin [Fusarium albosuccineum]|uniref:Hydrophobin n=1 Tax=Fusarium albosuccineum TaxID=1237068 RepID=A0A8H4JZ38_9HYPO|nr:hydrophobin [Fusarium albosuccineum]
MQPTTLLYGVLFLQGAMASPVADPAPEVGIETRALEPRGPTAGDIPFPRFPSRKPKGHGGSDCSTGGSVQQSNLCSAGNPYCCSSDGKGGHVCSNTSACEQTVICCNNNNGVGYLVPLLFLY